LHTEALTQEIQPLALVTLRILVALAQAEELVLDLSVVAVVQVLGHRQTGTAGHLRLLAPL
jgi:hypothetical protein